MGTSFFVLLVQADHAVTGVVVAIAAAVVRAAIRVEFDVAAVGAHV